MNDWVEVGVKPTGNPACHILFLLYALLGYQRVVCRRLFRKDLLLLQWCRQHDNGSALSLVDHLPEVSAGLLQRSLGYDERLLLSVTLRAVIIRSSSIILV